MEERDVGAVEKDVSDHVRRRNALTEERHVNDAKRRDDAGVR